MDVDHDQDFLDRVQQRRLQRMARHDRMSPELRSLVHEYGFNVVNQFMQSGVTKPKIIRHLVEAVLDEFSPTRGSFSSQGTRTPMIKPGHDG